MALEILSREKIVSVNTRGMSQLYNLTVQNLLAPVANITSLSGGTAYFTNINSSGTTSALNAANANVGSVTAQQANIAQANIQALQAQTVNLNNVTTAVGNTQNLTVGTGNVSVLNAQQANIQSLIGQTASFTTITSTGNSGSLTAAVGNLATINTQQANIVVLNAQTSNLGNVVGPLNVLGDIVLTGNLRQTLFANTPGGGYPNYVFGNLAASNISASTFFTVPTANIGTLTVGNLVGYVASGGSGVQPNLYSISGNTLNYTYGNVGTLTCGTALHSGNLIVQGINQVCLSNTNTINFGYDVANKEPNAGRVGYGTFSGGSLDVVGAGNTAGQRRVQILDGLVVSNYAPGAGNGSIVAGTAQLSGNVVAGSLATPGSLVYTTQNPGDMIVKAFPNPGDRYGVGQYSGGSTRMFTSSAFAGATVSMSLASTDGSGGTSALWSDLVSASQSSVLVNRPLVAGNVSANNVNVSSMVANNIATPGNLAVYGSQLLVQSGNSAPLQLVASPGGGAGSSIGMGFQTYQSRGGPSNQISAVDDGQYSAHIVLASAVPGSASNTPVERMRLTSYGNIGINQTAPQFLVHAQPTGTDIPAINPDATNSVMVYEDCKGSTLLSGTLIGNGAAYSQSSGYIQLTPQQNSTDGSINYSINPGTAFDVTVETYVGTSGTAWADGIAFYCFSNTAFPSCWGGNGNVGPSNNNGYTLVFDDYAQNTVNNPNFLYTVALYYNTTLLASQTAANFQIPLNTWNQVRISFVRNVWKVWMGSTQVINYQDTSRVLTGSGTNNIGFTGHCGGANANHWVRNIQISKHSQGPWRSAAGGNVPGILYNGPVAVNGNITVSGTNSLLLTGNGVSIPANNVGDWMTALYSGGVGDRYGLGQYANGQVRLFSSAIYSSGSVNLSLASQDSTGGNGTFTDVLTASNTSVVVRRPFGVGTTSPAYLMDVAGAARVQGNMIVNTANGNGVQLFGSYGTFFTATGGFGNCGVQMQSYPGRQAGPTIGIVNMDDANYSGHMIFQTANPGAASTSLSEKMRLTSTGYLGIGNSAPSFPLDVQGVAHFSSQTIQSYPTTTRYYQSSSSASTTAGNPIPMTVSMFTGNCPGNYNSTSTLFTTNTTTNPGSCNAQCPLITIPYAGIWALVLTMRFNATASENSLWFAPYVSPVWGETSANGNQSRCGYTATSAAQLTTSFTGYFGTGDTIALCAYSSAANQLVTFYNQNGITMTCINRSA